MRSSFCVLLPSLFLMVTACSSTEERPTGQGGSGSTSSSSSAATGVGGAGGNAAHGPSGSIDTSFGDKGYYRYNASNTVLAGEEGGFIASVGISMLRFRLAGTMDPSVDVIKQVSDFEQLLPAGAGQWIGIYPDPNTSVTAIKRLSTALSVDTTFNATQAMQGFPPAVGALASDGSVVLAGLDSSGPEKQLMLRKLAPTGAIDATFGVGGTVLSPLTMVGYDREIVIQKDGKIIVGATSASAPVLMRFAADGAVDTSYGTKGIASLSNGNTKQLRGIRLDKEGRALVLCGNTVTRLLDTGALDQSFGIAGVVAVSVPTSGPDETLLMSSLDLQSDAKLVVAGSVFIDKDSNGVPSNGSPVLARFDANGKVDKSFGNDGSARVQLDEKGVVSLLYGRQSVVALPDGRLAVGGVESPSFGSRSVITVVWQ
jgi:uncharacterized delta-60 repeat protein